MTILGTYEKQPDEIESYSINYADDLTSGDGIKDHSVVIAPAGLVLDFASVDSPRVKLTLSGGVDRAKYKVTVTANTDDGRRLQDEFFIKIKEH